MNLFRDHSSLKGSDGKRGSAFCRGPRGWDLLDWQAEDAKSYRVARLIKLTLGGLPKRLAKFGHAAFDLEEDRQYGMGPDAQAAGRDLAGLAAHIVRCAAKHPADYLLSLRGISAAIAEPIKTYFRVKLALGRLEAEIEAAQEQHDGEAESYGQTNADITFSPKPTFSTKAHEPPGSRIFSTENSGAIDGYGAQTEALENKPTPKTFTWDVSPAKAYGFKDMTAQYGYDPRDTSAYWIERRAGALRRKWAAYRRRQSGETPSPARAPKCPAQSPHEPQAALEPLLRRFEPADADYNTVWPPIQLPAGPPKDQAGPKPSAAPQPARTATPQPGISDAVISEPVTLKLVSDTGCVESGSDAETDADFGAVYAAMVDTTAETSVIHQNVAPMSQAFQSVKNAALAAREQAKESGAALVIPADYAERFGMGEAGHINQGSLTSGAQNAVRRSKEERGHIC